MQLTSTASNLLETGNWKESIERWKQKLSFLPPSIQYRLTKQFAWYHINQKDDTGKGVDYSANVFLRESLKQVTPRFDQIFGFCNRIQKQGHSWRDLDNIERTKKRALSIAMEMIEFSNEVSEQLEDGFEINAIRLYWKMGCKVEEYGIVPPYWAAKLWKWKKPEQLAQNAESALSGILKMTSDKWWLRKMKKHRLQTLEWLEIATGNVRKGASPYASKQAVAEYKERQRSCADWMRTMQLDGKAWDEETQTFFNQTISLEQAYNAGMANPENRRNELMLRIRETEEYAEELGYIGMFYTITLPSAYHAVSDKWNGCQPKEAHNHFMELWAKMRTRLNDHGCRYFGIRVAEPHADGTPHCHMALFMHPSEVQKITAIMRWYAIQEDKDELYARATKEQQTKLRAAYRKARQACGFKKSKGKNPKPVEKFYRVFSPRFTAVKINKKYGSATSYIAKYIAKNIDGFKITSHEDAETGEAFEKSISPVAAWASNWGIRQFGWQGSPSVMVYRELRKVRESIQNPELEAIRKAADNADWIGFVKAMGGMNAGRSANYKVMYESDEINDYNEPLRRVKGVRGLGGSVITRAVQWTLLKVEGAAEDLSWTCGNNCRNDLSGSAKAIIDEFEQEFGTQAKRPPNTIFSRLGHNSQSIKASLAKSWLRMLELDTNNDEFSEMNELLGVNASGKDKVCVSLFGSKQYVESGSQSLDKLLAAGAEVV